MARPVKNGLDYFPLDSSFFADPKIRILKARFGADGITMYLYILCEIYKNGYYLKMTDDTMYLMCESLRISEAKASQVMTFLFSRSLLKSILAVPDTIITSAGIQRRFQMAVKERAKKTPVKVDGRFWLLDPDETEPFIKVGQNPVFPGKTGGYSGKNDGFSPDLSLKERKENNAIIYSQNQTLDKAVKEYMAFRERKGKAMAPEEVPMLMDKLAGLDPAPENQAEILKNSIVGGYTGIYPLPKAIAGGNKARKKGSRKKFVEFEQRGTDYESVIWGDIKKKAEVNREDGRFGEDHAAAGR